MSKSEQLIIKDILLVEDNPGDARLTIEAFKELDIRTNFIIVNDGVEALNFLYKKGKYKERPIPDLILLDLNMPKKDGREVLAEIKKDKSLKMIPVVILTTSHAFEDIVKSYSLQANCFITKPVDIFNFLAIVQEIGEFWFNIATLPPYNILKKKKKVGK